MYSLKPKLLFILQVRKLRLCSDNGDYEVWGWNPRFWSQQRLFSLDYEVVGKEEREGETKERNKRVESLGVIYF